MFYAVSTHEFFYTIELRSNNLHPPSTSSLLLPLDNHKSQDYKSTDPHITRNNFFSMQGQEDKMRSAQLTHRAPPPTGRISRFSTCSLIEIVWSHDSVGAVRCRDEPRMSIKRWVRKDAHTQRNARVPSGRLKRERERERKSMCFFMLKHMGVV